MSLNTQMGVVVDVSVSLLPLQHAANWQASVIPSPSRRLDPGLAPGWLILWHLKEIQGYVPLKTVTEYGWESSPNVLLNWFIRQLDTQLYQQKINDEILASYPGCSLLHFLKSVCDLINFATTFRTVVGRFQTLACPSAIAVDSHYGN